MLAAERGEPVRFRTRELATTVREGCAHALFLVMRPLAALGASREPQLQAVSDPRKPPVLLLPGHRTGSAGLLFLQTFLRTRGWSTWVVTPEGSDRNLIEHAEALARRVEALCRQARVDQVDLVAHGTGGVVAAFYLRHRDEGRVRRLVTLGSPWQGSRTAVFGPGRIPHELHPASTLLDGLGPPPVPTVAIWSPDDPMVVPSASAVPPGAHGVCVEAAGSADMLVSARVFRAVQAALAEPLPAGAS